MANRFKMALVCGAANLWSTAVLAQSVGGDSPHPPSQAAGASDQIEEVVVVAQKRSEPLQSVPISAQVIAGAVLQAQNYNSLESLGTITPGVHIATGASTGNDIYVRGIGSGENQFFDQAVATFVDDIYHGRSRTSAATFLDLDHIEILKGPQSTFFGNNAIAGAINILTKRPGDSEEGYARVLYGSYGTYAAEGAITEPISETLSVRGAAILSGQGGWIHNVVTGEEAPRDNNKAARLTFLYTPTTNLDVTVKLEGAQERQEGTPYGGAPQIIGCSRSAQFVAFFGGNCAIAKAEGLPLGFGNDLNSGLPGQGSLLTSYEGVTTINYKLDQLTLTSVTGYSQYNYDNEVDGANLAIDSLTSNSPENNRQFSQEFRVASPTGQKLEYLAGVYFQDDRLVTLKAIDLPSQNGQAAKPQFAAIAAYLPIGYNVHFAQDEQIYGAFGSLTWNLTDQLKATVGLRVTDDHKAADLASNYGMATQTFGGVVPVPANVAALDAVIFGHGFGTPATQGSFARSDHAWLPSAKVQYEVAPAVMAYASYSRGFLAGGFNGEDTTGVASNVPYQPEYVDAYEIGIKSKLFDGRVLLDADLFRSDYSNLQVNEATPTAIAGVIIRTIRNAAESRSQGVEVEGQWVVTSQFRLSTNVTYLDSKFISYPGASATFDQSALGLKTQDLSGRPTQYSPKWSGRLAATYTQPLGADFRMVAELSTYFTSSYFVGSDADDPYFHQNAYAQLDGRVSFLYLPKRWTLDVIGKNLNNLQTFENGLGALLAWKAEPRNFAVQLRHDF